jgi:KDO2-lipid IV(A) lauroyltransferase
MSSIRSLRFLIEFGIIRALISLLRVLPLDLASGLGGRMAMLVGPRTSLHRRAVANITIAMPELSASERDRILKSMWRNTGLVLVETLLLDRLVADPYRIEIVNAPQLEQALGVAGPHVGVTLHFGNWELAAWVISECGGKLAGIYRPLRNPWLDRYIQARRQPLYPGGLLFKGTKGGTGTLGESTRQAIDFLRKGGHLGFTADQVESSAPFKVPFFGGEATFTPAPALFARRLNARIWLGRCRRIDASSRFRFEYRELMVPRSADPAADIQAMTAELAAQFEAWIREAPEQWMWWQRRSIRA